ncbi:MAG: T9SS type A sorting domain-containing protein [Bacteroidales bacterium]|nr:T9SS type A sorting domain-containing protein [Bacteroidales bacterium]
MNAGNISKIEVFTISGQKICLSTNNNQIDLSNYPKALYFVRVSTESGVFVEKVVLE